MTSFRVIALALSMLMITGMVKGRWLDLETYSTSMISYGGHNISNENPPNLELRFSNSSMSYGGKRCKSLYTFFPCANTMPEGVFLMFVYTYLMVSGEEWMNTGSKLLYVWIGADEKVGASVFRVLMAFPKIVVFVVPGILSSASDAKSTVVFGLNMYAGSTVITLTLVWGISIIFSKHKVKKEKEASQESGQQQDSSRKCLSQRKVIIEASQESDQQQASSRNCLSRRKVKKEASQESDQQQASSRKCLSLKHKLSFRTDASVKIDKETGIIAGIMLLSLIPFAFVGLISFVKTTAMTLPALIVSGESLLLYFGFQVYYYPWIGARSLTNLQHKNLAMRFLDYVKSLAEHVDLVDMDEKPDSTCLKSFFKIVDKNDDNIITHDELETLVEKIFKLQNDSISKEYAKTVIFMNFDENRDEEISWDEFKLGCTKLLKKLYKEAKKSESPYQSICDEILRTIKKRQDSKLSIIQIIMPSILKQVLEKKELVTKDGQPNRQKIEGLFSDIDNDDKINKDELKQFIETLDFGIELDRERVLHALVKDFNKDKNKVVEKKEFVDGFIKWIEEAINHEINHGQSVKDIDEAIEKIQKDICGKKNTDTSAGKKTWEKCKAIVYVIFGAAIMITVTSAFVTSVKQFSNAAHIPFLFTSFVMAPIALKAKMAIKALRKTHDQTNASLTFSEIYDELVMNNLLGLFSLLVTLYIKGLSWTYSAEVFTIMNTCAIVGIFAFKRDNYPLWASIPAILLYPVSVYIYYVLAKA